MQCQLPRHAPALGDAPSESSEVRPPCPPCALWAAHSHFPSHTETHPVGLFLKPLQALAPSLDWAPPVLGAISEVSRNPLPSPPLPQAQTGSMSQVVVTACSLLASVVRGLPSVCLTQLREESVGSTTGFLHRALTLTIHPVRVPTLPSLCEMATFQAGKCVSTGPADPEALFPESW